MKFLKKIFVAAAIISAPLCGSAQSLGDLLNGLGGGSGGGIGDVLGNVIEGVFTKSNLTVEDLVGEYVSQGPAVTFKSDNLLQKAGGIAGAATIESKLNPYYEKYGLNGMTLTIDTDANFSMKIKALSLNGTITKNESEGTFEFNFKVVGVNLGKFTAYIEKSGSNLKLMFDATKLKTIISAVAKFTGNSMASALGSILDSYDGACIGFKMAATSTSSNKSASDNTSTDSNSSSSSSAVSSGVDALKNILKKNN